MSLSEKSKKKQFSLKLFFVGASIVALVIFFFYTQHIFLKNLNKVESISTFQAKCLVNFYAKNKQTLFLNGLTQIDSNTAKILASWDGNTLYLNGLRKINRNVAKCLALWNGESLRLKGLKQIDSNTAEALVAFKGKYLYLNGLNNIEISTIKTLFKFKNRIYVGKVSSQMHNITIKALTLNKKSAQTLVAFKNHRFLLFSKLKIIYKRRTAEVSAKSRSEKLYLNSLEQIDESIARILSQFKGKYLILRNIKEIDSNTAKALISFKGKGISLRGLTKVNKRVLQVFSKYKGIIYTKDEITKKIQNFKKINSFPKNSKKK